jgi:TetR/AcrR family transcriptional repressor of nem operon
MRLTREDAANNRLSIIEASGRMFRERGFDAVPLVDLMKEAGFTHGGFYNHFASKEALAAEATSAAFKQANAELIGALKQKPKSGGSPMSQYVERYLSQRHRDARATGCTLAALASDTGRQSKQVQATFAKGIEEEIVIFSKYFREIDSPEQESISTSTRERAIQQISEMVGAVILARAVADGNSALSDEILEANRRRLSGKGKKGRGSGKRRLSRKQKRSMAK